MRRQRLPSRALAPTLVVVLVLLSAAVGATRGQANGPVRGMVAAGHPLAADTGVEVLRSGGNAVDAAVAVGLMLGVVDGYNSGLGGGCFMLIHRANGRVVALDGRETAPAAATRDMFVRNGRADPALSQTGPLASGVPGQLAVFDHAVRHYGRKQLRDLLRPAAAVAERGFAVSRDYAERVRSVADELARFESSRAVFFRNGAPIQPGDMLKQPDLAATYRAIGEQGVDWFYRGPFARVTEQWMKANGGMLSAGDFGRYRPEVRKPVRAIYRGVEIITFGPPSSGGVHLVQMLNMLEPFDLRALDEATRRHVLAETMKRAFADRAHWLGDPRFARVPRGLTSKAYAAVLAAQIHLEHATPVPGHGWPPRWQRDVFPGHTTHFSVADAEGNWVACSATINTTFGSKVIVPGTGVLLNNEMDDFSAQPGVPNAFGLVGAEANAPAPGKRPLSSMTPTIVLRHGRPVLALGASGGPRIITAVLGVLVGIWDLGLTPAEAVAAPRIHHQWSPDELVVEPALPGALQRALAERGHSIVVREPLGIVHLVGRDRVGGPFFGVADPRGNGRAVGW